MRKLLDTLYSASEWMAMGALSLITALVFAQVAGRVYDAALKLIGLPPYGFLIPSLAEIAGFLLVAASFLGLAGSLRAGAQIRVTLVIGQLPDRARRLSEALVLAAALAIAGFFFRYVIELAADSYRFNEVSFGIIPIPLWIPQGLMAAGAGIFAIAMLDDLVAVLRGGEPVHAQDVQAVTGE